MAVFWDESPKKDLSDCSKTDDHDFKKPQEGNSSNYFDEADVF